MCGDRFGCSIGRFPLHSAICNRTLNLACRTRPQSKTVPLNLRQCTRRGEPLIRSAINDGSRDGAGAASTPDGGRCGWIVPREHMMCAQTSAAALAQRRHPHSINRPRPPAPSYSAQKMGLADVLRCSILTRTLHLWQSAAALEGSMRERERERGVFLAWRWRPRSLEKQDSPSGSCPDSDLCLRRSFRQT